MNDSDSEQIQLCFICICFIIIIIDYGNDKDIWFLDAHNPSLLAVSADFYLLPAEDKYLIILSSGKHFKDFYSLITILEQGNYPSVANRQVII